METQRVFQWFQHVSTHLEPMGSQQFETSAPSKAEEGSHMSGPVVPKKAFWEIIPVMATIAWVHSCGNETFHL